MRMAMKTYGDGTELPSDTNVCYRFHSAARDWLIRR